MVINSKYMSQALSAIFLPNLKGKGEWEDFLDRFFFGEFKKKKTSFLFIWVILDGYMPS